MSGRGSAFLARYRKGEKSLTRGQSILAKCAECMADYADGRVDCGVTTCPLYPFQPYGAFSERKTSEPYIDTREDSLPLKNVCTGYPSREKVNHDAP